MGTMSSPLLRVSDEVRQAKADDTPIVALESTILAQGLPYPQNLETAQAAAGCIRASGAVPATIALIGGRIAVGLTQSEIERICTATDVKKAGRSDLPHALMSGELTATTVSSTMIGAHLAGLDVFATGGIGGVHRGFDLNLDISQDLTELAETPVIVVASGAKAILDIAKTLEVLETLGVTVATYGQDDFPAFWSRSSGYPSPNRFDCPSDFAKAFLIRRRLNLPGGLLAANPIPEEAAIPAARITPWIESALAEAERRQVTGKRVTPYLLQKITEESDGESLRANMELVKCNATLAAMIATALLDVSAL